ncbi:MAG: hypothetical protein Kow00107_11340 [Planctomycetota bacterium]
MNPEARQALKDIVAQHGRNIIEDPSRLDDAFRSHARRFVTECNVFAAAARLRIPVTLSILAPSEPCESLLPRLASKFEKDFALRSGVAQWVVAAWAEALGVDVPPGFGDLITNVDLAELPLEMESKRQAAPSAESPVPAGNQFSEGRSYAAPLPIECSSTSLPETPDGFVVFNDKALEGALRNACDKHIGGIKPSDLEGITVLEAPDLGIQSLAGIEFCANLKHLNLRCNRISDILPLRFLESLEDLDLASNEIHDVSPIGFLVNLKKLDLRKNQISDLAPLVRGTCRGTLRGGFVYLSGNPLSSDAVEIHFHILQARNIQVVATDF